MVVTQRGAHLAPRWHDYVHTRWALFMGALWCVTGRNSGCRVLCEQTLMWSSRNWFLIMTHLSFDSLCCRSHQVKLRYQTGCWCVMRNTVCQSQVGGNWCLWVCVNLSWGHAIHILCIYYILILHYTSVVVFFPSLQSNDTPVKSIFSNHNKWISLLSQNMYSTLASRFHW